MNEEYTYGQVESYLLGKVNLEEALEIDKKINSDPEFAAFVEEQSLLHFAIVESYRDDLSQDIGQLISRKETRKKLTKWGLLGLFLLSAALVSYWIANADKKPTPPSKSKERSEVLEKEQETDRESISFSTPTLERNDSTITVETVMLQESQLKPSVMMSDTSDSDSVQIQLIEEPAQAEPNREEPTHQKQESASPCSNTKVELTFTFDKPCEGEFNGAIHAKASGGTSPYQFSLSGEQSVSGSYSGLESGFYEIYAEDNNGCVSDPLDEVFLEAKPCLRLKSSFDPNLESWSFEYPEEVRLIIRDKSGQIVFEQQGDNFDWNGQNQSGSIVPIGQYIYLIKKSGSVIDKGFVSVIY